jgi:hypothetical protein
LATRKPNYWTAFPEKSPFYKPATDSAATKTAEVKVADTKIVKN